MTNHSSGRRTSPSTATALAAAALTAAALAACWPAPASSATATHHIAPRQLRAHTTHRHAHTATPPRPTDAGSATANTTASAPSQTNRAVCRAVDVTLQVWCEISDILTTDTPGRAEGQPPVGDNDIDAAYDNLGTTAAYYHHVLGINLTDLIGLHTADTQPALSVTIGPCPDLADTCDEQNASWVDAAYETDPSGREMLGGSLQLGPSTAQLLDVVAHEATHGVTDARNPLDYLDESGAINESTSDVLGELTQRWAQRQAGLKPDNWLIGEGGPWGTWLRSMRNPRASLDDTTAGQPGCTGGQPDWTGSPCYVRGLAALGAVHTNSGVGNKTAYLISSGGTFRHQSIKPAGDDTTAVLWLAAVKLLKPDAMYADLAHALAGACVNLVHARRIPARTCRDTVLPAIRATALGQLTVTATARRSRVRTLEIRTYTLTGELRGGVAVTLDKIDTRGRRQQTRHITTRADGTSLQHVTAGYWRVRTAPTEVSAAATATATVR